MGKITQAIYRPKSVKIRNYVQYLEDGHSSEDLNEYCIYPCGYAGLNGNHTILNFVVGSDHYRIWLLHLDDKEFRFYDSEGDMLTAKMLMGRE